MADTSSTTTNLPIEDNPGQKYYIVKNNDGTSSTKTLKQLSDAEKKALSNNGVAEGGKTDRANNPGKYSSITLDKSTGKITVSAPSYVLEREGFKSEIGQTLETLSSYYKKSKDYAIPQQDGSTKTVEEIINELNDENSDNSIKKYIDSIAAMRKQEYGDEASGISGDRKVYGIDDKITLNDNYFTLRNTVALGSDTSDDSRQAISDLPEFDFMRDLESYDSETGTASLKDIMENAWNRDKYSDDKLKSARDALERYFAQGDYEDTDALAKNIATYEFITGKDPDVNWLRNVVETTGAFLEGAGQYIVDTGGNLFLGTTATIFDTVDDVTEHLFETVTGKEYEEAKIWVPQTGSSMTPKEYTDTVLNYWEEVKDDRAEDRSLLSDTAAAATKIGYGITKLATLISAGNAASAGAKLLMGEISASVAMGAQLAAEGGAAVNAVQSGISTMVALLSPSKAAALANIVTAIEAAAPTSAAIGLIGETLGESIMQNPRQFYEILSSGELSAEAKQELWGNFIGNTLGWAGGIAIGKGLVKLGQTTVGQSISHNISRRIYKVQDKLHDITNSVRFKVHGVDNAVEYVKKLLDRKKIKKADAYSIDEMLMDAKRAVANTDDIHFVGKTKADIQSQLDEVREEVGHLLALENAVDEMRRHGRGILSAWLSSGQWVEFEGAAKSLDDAYSVIRKAEKAAGAAADLKKVGGLAISQDTVNYIQGMNRLAILNSMEEAAAKKGLMLKNAKGMAKERKALQEMIDAYTKKAPSEVKIAADSFITAERTAMKEANNLLLKEGLLTKADILDKRASGLWGEDGELYVPLMRQKEFNNLHKQQMNFLTEDTVRRPQSYVFGADDDFTDPLAMFQLHMMEYADKLARQNTIKAYMNVTGTVNTELLNVAQTRAARIANSGVMNESEKQATKTVEFAAKYVVRGSGIVDDIYTKNLSVAKLRKSAGRSETAMESLVREQAKPLSEYKATPTNIHAAVLSMSKSEVTDLWRTTAGHISVEQYILENYKDLPRSTKSLINEQYGLYKFANAFTDERYSRYASTSIMSDGIVAATDALADTTDAFGSIESASSLFGKMEIDTVAESAPLAVASRAATGGADAGTDLLSGISEVNTNIGSVDSLASKAEIDVSSLGKTTEGLDKYINSKNVTSEMLDNLKNFNPDFYDSVRRDIISRTNAFKEMEELQTLGRAYAHNAAVAQKELRLEQRWGQFSENLSKDAELKAAIADTVEDNLEKTLEFLGVRPASSKAYKELAQYYGLEDDVANRYFALRTICDDVHKKKTKKEIFKQVKLELKEQVGADELLGDYDKVAEVITGEIMLGFENEYARMTMYINQVAPRLVDQRNMYAEVRKIVTKEKLLRNQKETVVAIQDAAGEISYIETSPLVAHLMNYSYLPGELSKWQKANYLMSKFFRLGTTSIRLTSLVNQTFRDFGNAFIGGNVYRTWSSCVDEMRDVLGDSVVDYIRASDSELADSIEATAKASGRSADEVAFETIKKYGEAISPEATETAVYQHAGNVRTSIKASKLGGGIDDATEKGFGKITDGINAVEDKLGKLNHMRESTLRNASFRNAFTDAVKKGYSFADAKTWATFTMSNATTNFGRATKMFSNLQDSVPFLGAAINGTKSFWRLVALDPVGVIGRLMGGVVLPTMALTAYSLHDEQNREVWENLSEYQKDDNLVFVVDGQILSVPMPQELTAIISPFRQLVEKMYDANRHSFWELAANDLIGLSPIELSGFTNIDAYTMADGTSEDNFFVNNIEPGLAKLFSQLAPVPVKALAMYATGIDPYTMKKIDRSYKTVDPDTGETVIMNDYAGALGKTVANLLKDTPFAMSATMAEKILGSIFGKAPIEYIGWLVELGQGVTSGSWEGLGEHIDSVGQGVFESITDPLYIEQYRSAADADWRNFISKMYTKKEELLNSDEWQNYMTQYRNATTPEEIEKLKTVRANLLNTFYEDLKTATENLVKNYGQDTFTAEKYAAIISLSVMSQMGVDSSAYGKEISDEVYSDARRQAINTLYKMGFTSPTDYSAFGYITTSSTGETYVAMSTPMALLNARNEISGADELHYANIKSLLEANGLDTSSNDYQDMASRVGEIYSKNNLTSSDYERINRIYKQWDAKVMRVLFSYISTYGEEAVLNNARVNDLLDNVIKVPSDYEVNNKGYYLSASRLNKQRGFAQSYVKYIYERMGGE